MKKVITLLFVLFVVSYQSNGVRSEVINNRNADCMQQFSEWESLGTMTAISYYGRYEQFGLFVKTIRGMTYYQVRRYYSVNNYINSLVTLGKFTHKQKTYNAKFIMSNVVYYFDL